MSWLALSALVFAPFAGVMVWALVLRHWSLEPEAARLKTPRDALPVLAWVRDIRAEGPLGRAVIKVSAVKPQNRVVEAPAIVFRSQRELLDRFKAGDLNRDFVAVVRFQGPKANGMPELHKLTPPLGVLQDKGFKVALVTDGRMSGASGKVPAAIHLSPEALDGGPIGKVRDGDVIRLDADKGVLDILVDRKEFAARPPAPFEGEAERWGTGRELFAGMRALVTSAETGAMTFMLAEEESA